MADNLRDRLKRIHGLKRPEKILEKNTSEPVSYPAADLSSLTDNRWVSCGYLTFKREISVNSPFKFTKNLPFALPVIVPDFCRRDSFNMEDFIFFDLETTGLSGGAGTVAFLAAFGRPLLNGKLCLTQYLLLDYPGENDFLEAVLKNFYDNKSVIISYNGKSFDANILKTRCLMNGIKPPEYFHADLLHPARRLWKNIITDCSQASVETQVIGIDRSGDIPGALAPEIWFEFLKSGRTDRLMGICDHNIRDITGLTRILHVMISIAEDPLASIKYNYNPQRLALYWRDYIRRAKDKINQDKRHESYAQFNELQITGYKLLRYAAEKNYPRASYVYSFDLMRNGDYGESLEFARRALKLFNEDTVWQNKLSRRIERLEKKI